MSGSVTVLKNSTVTYTIEKEGYTTVTNTVVVSEDTSTTVTMDLALVTLTIEPDPSDATVTLTAAGYTQSGNSISVAPGTTVNYSVSKEGYTTVTGSEVCTINRTINCTLENAVRTITATIIYQPSDLYGLTINGTNYPMDVNTPLTVPIEVGTDVVLEPYSNMLACYISETSNESYISMSGADSFNMYRKRSFKMPNEDLSFKFYSNGDPI